jgi:hypothetical protein
MKKLLLLSVIFVIYSNSYSQANQNSKAPNRLSSKVLLDSICNYLLLSSTDAHQGAHGGSHGWYSEDRKIFSNNLIDSGRRINYGFISIDTLNLAIRFNATGTSGSGGFAPYVQETFYFQNFDTLDWSEGNVDDNKLYLSGIKEHNKEHRYIVEVEVYNGSWGSEDRIYGFPDFSIKYYREYIIVFATNRITDKDKDKLSNWLNELKNR